MRILIVEDDFASRKFMMNFMSAYGDCDGTVDGMEAVEAYMMALEDEQPYDLICLDVMMPVMDGYQVLNTIRNMEKQLPSPDRRCGCRKPSRRASGRRRAA